MRSRSAGHRVTGDRTGQSNARGVGWEFPADEAGSLLTREWNGKLERVMVLEKGFAWNGKSYGSLSQIAKAMTGTSWNGHRFFGLRTARPGPSARVGRRERSNDTDAPVDAGSIGPVPDREVRRRPASPDEACAPAGMIAVAHPEGRRRNTAGPP